jgi:hypothetical protein
MVLRLDASKRASRWIRPAARKAQTPSAAPTAPTPQPDLGADQRPVGCPAEPADDAAARVVQRLRFAAGGAVLVGVEAQVLQAREPRDQRQPRIVEAVAVAEHAAHLVERKLER